LHPWLVFLKESGKRLSDIEFLAIKEFDSKLVDNEAVQAATGTGATLTASSGKDLYLAGAQITIFRDTSSSWTVTAELQANGVVLETIQSQGFVSADTLTSNTISFKAIGNKVAATQVLKIEITVSTNATTESFIQGFEETTGESPAV